MKKIGRTFTKLQDIDEQSESCGVIFMDMNELFQYCWTETETDRKIDNEKKNQLMKKARIASALLKAKSDEDKDKDTIKVIKTVKEIQQLDFEKKMEFIQSILEIDCENDCSLMNLVLR